MAPNDQECNPLDDPGNLGDDSPSELDALRLHLQVVEHERDHCLAVCEQAGINPWTAVIRLKPVSNKDALAVHNAQHPQSEADGVGLFAEEVEIHTAEEIERAAADAIPATVWMGEQP